MLKSVSFVVLLSSNILYFLTISSVFLIISYLLSYVKKTYFFYFFNPNISFPSMKENEFFSISLIPFI